MMERRRRRKLRRPLHVYQLLLHVVFFSSLTTAATAPSPRPPGTTSTTITGSGRRSSISSSNDGHHERQHEPQGFWKFRNQKNRRSATTTARTTTTTTKGQQNNTNRKNVLLSRFLRFPKEKKDATEYESAVVTSNNRNSRRSGDDDVLARFQKEAHQQDEEASMDVVVVSRGGETSHQNPGFAPTTIETTEAVAAQEERHLLHVLSDSNSESDSNSDDSLSSSSSISSSSDDEEEEVEDLLFKTASVNLKRLNRKRRQFLDHVAEISSNFLNKEAPASLTTTTAVTLDDKDNKKTSDEHDDDNQITPQTDLSLPGRHFHIVTTAALPWMTGTAVNPLLRAAYLHRRTQQINSNYNIHDVIDMDVVLENSENHHSYTTTTKQQHHQQQWVTLVIPWLELEEDQLELYGQVFASPQDQEVYIRDWLANHAGMPDVADPIRGLKLLFYPARYHSGLRSIFAMGDICQLIKDDVANAAPAASADVCVLEEPEHCNWYRAPGDGWTKQFHYVVGIVHTNYKEYASAHYTGLWTAPAIALMSSAMVRAYCHQVIKLSDVLQTFAPEKEATSNVHGVRADFLEIGLARARRAFHRENYNDEEEDTTEMPVLDNDDKNTNQQQNATTTVYFIGKLLWTKGLDLLLELEDYYKQCTGHYFAIDIYGSGPEQAAIRRAYWGRKLVSKNKDGNNASSSLTNTTQHRHHHHRKYHRHRRHHHHHKKERNQSVTTTTIFTSTAAFKEHLRKIKESLPAITTADHWRNLKESITSAELQLPTTFAEWRRQPIPATFPGRVDHASLGQQQHDNYKVFVNPSVSEVLCTTTAEALAMGKFAIIPVHPSNAFFLKFPNCLAYRNKFEFAANLQWALTHDPEPLTPELAHEFTWEAATDRFIQASAVTWKEAREREALGLSKRDERIAWFLNELGKGQKGDIIRMVLGGGPASGQVKYVSEKQSSSQIMLDDDDDEEDNDVAGDGVDDDDEEDEGLTKKFQQSSFVQALRATVANGLPSTIARNTNASREG